MTTVPQDFLSAFISLVLSFDLLKAPRLISAQNIGLCAVWAVTFISPFQTVWLRVLFSVFEWHKLVVSIDEIMKVGSAVDSCIQLPVYFSSQTQQAASMSSALPARV